MKALDDDGTGNVPAQTPMSDHVARFWKLLAEHKVHIVVDCVDENASSMFPDDVAKAVVADHASGILHGEQRERERIVKWLREKASKYDEWDHEEGMLRTSLLGVATEIERGSK